MTKKKTLHYEIDLPGIEFGDIDITVLSGKIAISGTRSRTFQDPCKVNNGQECGTYEIALEVSKEYDINRTKATHKNGVLTLVIGLDASVVRKISITAG